MPKVAQSMVKICDNNSLLAGLADRIKQAMQQLDIDSDPFQ